MQPTNAGLIGKLHAIRTKDRNRKNLRSLLELRASVCMFWG